MARISMTFNLSACRRRDQKSNAHVVYCPALNLYTAARTLEEVALSMKNAAEVNDPSLKEGA